MKVVFCNTGKERPETLDFVERCSQRWGVPVTWLEYRHTKGVGPTFAVVDYGTASRDGEASVPADHTQHRQRDPAHAEPRPA